jgi:hypothetical protein
MNLRPSTPLGRPRPPIDRSFDRLIALAAVAIAISMVATLGRPASGDYGSIVRQAASFADRPARQ